jgi:hypothetical protein
VINQVRLSLTGKAIDSTGVAKGVFLSLGFAALSDIHADFVRKARGGTGEDGVKWPPLSPKTLAYSRRFGPGEQTRLKRAHGLGRGHKYAPVGTGLLSAAQLRQWRLYFRRNLAWLITKYDPETAKSIAAGMAWNRIKAEGGKTKLQVYGNRPHEILRDTGVLLNSLSPGELGGYGVSYRKPTGDGGDNQIFAALANGVIVGTNVKYAATHQYGDSKRRIPARPYLPAKVPDLWWGRWSNALSNALEIGLSRMIQGGASA